ncbi:MAG: alanine-tRNA synthetase second additional domain-containing protein [Clostridia bacterium]|nr:alanine-tRNA synthetase second additional domain-containing protein [Clostridia bacterium]
MNPYLLHEKMMHATYFAPRGKQRMYNLGHQLAQRHLNAADNIIGFIGAAGAGKSRLIAGMFPGLELTNDDEGVNIRPLPLLDSLDSGFFSSHTYHVDVRFESAFVQLNTLAEAIRQAVKMDKRVIIEHFDLIYDSLGMDADVMVAIGEEVIVTRPTIFGPKPSALAKTVFNSIKYRRMAHSAEDLTNMILENEYSLTDSPIHGDIRHGFLLEFEECPTVPISELEQKVIELINKNIPIDYYDDAHIVLGQGEQYHCTGPRLHVKATGEIQNFRLEKEYIYDPKENVYLLAGRVGEEDLTEY